MRVVWLVGLAGWLGCAHAEAGEAGALPELALKVRAVRQRGHKSGPEAELRVGRWDVRFMAAVTLRPRLVPRPFAPEARQPRPDRTRPRCASASLCAWERRARRRALRRLLARGRGGQREEPSAQVLHARGGPR